MDQSCWQPAWPLTGSTFSLLVNLAPKGWGGSGVGEGDTSALKERGEVLITIFGEIGKILGAVLQ